MRDSDKDPLNTHKFLAIVGLAIVAMAAQASPLLGGPTPASEAATFFQNVVLLAMGYLAGKNGQ